MINHLDIDWDEVKSAILMNSNYHQGNLGLAKSIN